MGKNLREWANKCVPYDHPSGLTPINTHVKFPLESQIYRNPLEEDIGLDFRTKCWAKAYYVKWRSFTRTGHLFWIFKDE